MSDKVSAIFLEEKQSPECFIHPLLAQRRSLRAFSSRSVEPDTLRLMLEAARWAPSSMNEQPWSFLIAARENDADFNRLLGCLLEFNTGWAQHAPVLLLSIVRLRFASTGELNRHALYDAGQAMANLTFQASACGLSVCQMAGFDMEKTRHTFSIPSGHEPTVIAAVGYPGHVDCLPERLQKKVAAAQLRKPVEQFVFESTWGRSAVWVRRHPRGSQPAK
jgi:nitroreductase